MAQVPLLLNPVLDSNGDPYSGALVYTYEAGTTTLLDLFTDAALTTAAANPLVCDSSGMPPVAYATPDEYKFVFKTSGDATIRTVDDYTVTDPNPITASTRASQNKSADFTIASDDRGDLFRCDASSGTVNVTAGSTTLGDGFWCTVKNVGATGSVIVNAVGGEVIGGGSSYTVDPGVSIDIVSYGATGWEITANSNAFFIPAGSIMDYGGTSAPSGWLLCYGQAVSRTTYADLFTAISTTYGVGDGSTTFTLPDCRGRVTAGKDDMGGASANRLTDQSGGLNGDTLGDTGGTETHTLSVAELAAHGHPYRTSTDSGASGATGGFVVSTSATETTQTAFSGTVSDTEGEQIGGTGSDTAHNNVQPTIIFNKIIKT